LKVRFGDAFIGILLDSKLGSDENRLGEVRNQRVGIFGPLISVDQMSFDGTSVETKGS
jgi:hypothetical protein